MADDKTGESPTPVPGVVDVVPAETVDPLVSQHERELAEMRRQLEEALREAEAAEQHLGLHPAAAAYDDAFEADVLAHVAKSLSTLKTGLTGAAPGGTETFTATPSVRPTPEGGHGPAPNPSVVEPPPERRPPPPPGAARTVVVDRGAPRTVVVDRGAPSTKPREPSPSSAPPPPAAASVLAGDPGAEQFISAQANSETGEKLGRKRRGRKAKGHRLARMPARVLIQAGVVVVIVALLLLKLS